jgi:putative methionine-R-sulfoxide reductase with GAF domain
MLKQKETAPPRPPLGVGLRAASEALLVEDIHEALNAFLEEASRAVGAEAASILLVDKASKELFFAAATGEKAAEIINTRFAESKGVAGQVIATGEPAMVNDVAGSEKHYDGVDKKSDFDTRHLIACPLRHGDFRFGVLELINSNFGAFEERDLQTARVLANIASLAIWQSRAYARAFSALALDRAEFEAESPMIGDSRAIRSLLEFVPRVAVSDAPVLIRGESGTGKEVLARIVWKASKRSRRVFLATNCAAIPATLIESELFGHEKGSRSPAPTARSPGASSSPTADHLPRRNRRDHARPAGRSLLRVLQEQEFERVGGTKPVKVDVRVHRRHQPRPEEGGGCRALPRGPLLPPQRHPHRPAAAARPAGGHQEAVRVFRRRLQRVDGARGGGLHARLLRRPRVVRLAGEHPRVAQRAGAVDGPLGRHPAGRSDAPFRSEARRRRESVACPRCGRDCAIACCC